MATLSQWIGNWRAIANAVPDGQFEPISVEIDGRAYEILKISSFDQDIDGGRGVVRTAARDFDDKVALFTHLTRDMGIVRIISVRGRPRWVLEPGADSFGWVAITEGVSVVELDRAIREGVLGRRVARFARQKERWSRRLVEAQVRALRESLEDAEAEVGILQVELRSRERDLARYASE